MGQAADCREEIRAAGRAVIEKELTWGASGNISLMDEGRLYITASGSLLGALAPEDVIVAGESSGKKPSKELGMHQALYRRRPEIRAAIHASPFYTTLCASSDLTLVTDLFIESMYYLSRCAQVEYFHAGSAALADAVEAACGEADVIFLRNHGVLVLGETMREALCALEIVENACKMNVLANAGRFSLTPVAPETATAFLEGGYYRPKRNHGNLKED